MDTSQFSSDARVKTRRPKLPPKKLLHVIVQCAYHQHRVHGSGIINTVISPPPTSMSPFFSLLPFSSIYCWWPPVPPRGKSFVQMWVHSRTPAGGALGLFDNWVFSGVEFFLKFIT